jgi:hypothetical protein
MDTVTLTREEVETLTGYIECVTNAPDDFPVEPSDVQRAVLAKLEAVVSSPPSDSYVGGDK